LESWFVHQHLAVVAAGLRDQHVAAGDAAVVALELPRLLPAQPLDLVETGMSVKVTWTSVSVALLRSARFPARAYTRPRGSRAAQKEVERSGLLRRRARGRKW
jgi:hypothetical protein